MRILYGERIRGELLKLGIKACKRTIQKINTESKEIPIIEPDMGTFVRNHTRYGWSGSFSRNKASWPEIKVLVLTMHRSDEYFFEMLKAGASGYILKGAETRILSHAVRVIGQGEDFLYLTLTQKLVKDYLNFTQW